MTLPLDFEKVLWDRMTLADISEVMAVEQRAYTYPWVRANFIDALNAGDQTWVLRVEKDLLGYCVAMKGVEEAHLLNITVSPNHSRQGLAKLMLEALCPWARKEGADKILLEVRVGNRAAIGLYDKFGFIQIGLRKNYYPNGGLKREDAWVMSLSL